MVPALTLCAGLALLAQPLDSLPRQIDEVPATLVFASARFQPEPAPEPSPAVESPDHLKEIVDPGKPEKIASGMQFNEGPVWIPTKDGKPGWLLFSDIPADVIYRLDPPKTGETATPVEFRKPSGHSNGLFLDHDDRLLICEHDGRVSRIEADGSVAVLAASCEGKGLNSPNDLCVHSSGAIFFTDPPYGLGGRKAELDYRGVFRIDPDGKLHLLFKNLRTPNGICLSPDEKTLYVTNHGKGEIWSYALKGTNVEGNGTLLATTKFGTRAAGADGIRADESGNLYVAGAGGIHVFKASGESIGLIAIEESPTNLVFGDDDRRTIYATGGRGSIFRIRVKAPGAVK